jgi:hypothetical protein
MAWAYHRRDVAVDVYAEAGMSFDRSSNRGSGRTSAPGEAAPVPGPGKQTLTSQLDAAIQRRATEGAPGFWARGSTSAI